MVQNEEYFSWTKAQIFESEKRFRTKLINSLAGIRQVALIGTKSKSGQENLAIFNSIIHLGANPPLFGFISRPNSVDRHTLENIIETESYTLNFVNNRFLDEAHQTSARYGKDISEFAAVGLTPQYVESIFAPFLKEAEIKIEMKLQQVLDIEINQTQMIIGSIENIFFPKRLLAEDGFINPEKLLLSCGLDAYFQAEFIVQKPYAKP
jgi:flavin reductase (DIM6/NTAB) family NADH-FMN oxidoreductase RutF